MVTKDSVEKQLKKINFNANAWGRAEVNELPHILLDHEEIYECVNGVYDGGFALLVASNVRLLLVDKKPMNYLTVEDLRFDMINEIDYSHRLVGARISISAGSKNLSFMSLNQRRLRTAISHVQRCMAEAKKQQSEHAVDQNQHLAQINQQLQAYLLAQHQQQDKLRAELEEVQKGARSPEDIDLNETLKPSPELSDYLLARSLMEQAQHDISGLSGVDTGKQDDANPPRKDQNDGQGKDSGKLKAMDQIQEAEIVAEIPALTSVHSSLPPAPAAAEPVSPQMADLYSAGMQEIYGRRAQAQDTTPAPQAEPSTAGTAVPPVAQHQATPAKPKTGVLPKAFDINPLHIAYSKLPMALRNKKFGRPSFHAHSRQETQQTTNPQYYNT
jgi:hypothetical protein